MHYFPKFTFGIKLYMLRTVPLPIIRSFLPYTQQQVYAIQATVREGTSKCSNEVYNKFTNIRQHKKYLLEHIGYMFRPVNTSSSGLQQKKSRVLLRNLDTNIFYSCKQI